MTDTAVDPSASFEDLLQFLYLTPVGIVKFRVDGTIDLMNPMATQLLLPLASAGDLENVYDTLAPLVPNLRATVDAFFPVAGTIVDSQRLETLAGNSPIVLALTVNRVEATVYMAVIVDVTKLAEQERKLIADQQRFRAIFAYVRDYAIYTVALDGRIDEWNQSLQRLGGWEAADVEGNSIDMFFPSGEAEIPEPAFLLAEAKRSGSFETEGWLLKRDGSHIWANTIITAIPDETGSVRGFVFVARDMTERKRMEDELEQLSIVDPLTGAYNRRHGHVRLTTELQRRARFGLAFSILMLDVDHFKRLNDTFGHAAGDAMLLAMVQACKTALRAVDMVARWGGEEFVIVLPETTAPAAMLIADRLRETIAAIRVPLSSLENLTCTVSIGVADAQNDDAGDLLRRADAALYAAKSGGRNRVVLAAKA